MPTSSSHLNTSLERALPVLLAAGLALLSVTPARGAAISWAAAGDGQWKDHAKWTPRGAPDSDTAEVTIDKVAAVTLNGTATVKTLTLDDAGSRLIGNGKLRLHGTALVKRGSVYWKDSTFESTDDSSRKLEFEAGGTFDLVGANKFTNVYLLNSGTTNIKAVKIGMNNIPAKVDMTNALYNYGALNFTSDIAADTELNFGANQFLVNGNGGTVKFEAGAGGKRIINGDVTNHRIMVFNAPTTINGVFENRAVIDHNGNKVEVNEETTVGTAAGTSMNTGIIEIAKDKRLIVKGKLNNLAAVVNMNPEGIIRGQGTLVMPNDKLTDKGTISCKRAANLLRVTDDVGGSDGPNEPDPVLTIEGAYEKSGGIVEVDIVGFSPYHYETPRIHVLGHAEILAGDLAVSFSGALPGLGAKFSVMTSTQPISGAFASSTVQAGEVLFGVLYNDPDNVFNPYNVTLQVLSVPAPGAVTMIGLAGVAATRRRRPA